MGFWVQTLWRGIFAEMENNEDVGACHTGTCFWGRILHQLVSVRGQNLVRLLEKMINQKGQEMSVLFNTKYSMQYLENSK